MKQYLLKLFTIVAAFGAFSTSAQSHVDMSEVEGGHLATIEKIDPLASQKALTAQFEEQLAKEAADQAIAEDLLSYAASFKGVRYHRGGKTPKAFDCSGFTGYVFREFGYKLGASSAAQYKDGVAVDSDDVQPGDLLFFTGRSAKSGRVGHVGIAVSVDPTTGDITFIHASTSRGVTTDKVSSPYFAKRYIGARRVIGVNE